MSKLGRIKRKAAFALALSLVFAEAASFHSYAATPGTVTCDVLNVRSGASTNDSVIGTLTQGTKVDIISTENGWHAININGTTGYISAQYVSTDSTGGSGTNASGQSGSVNVSVLNIRSQANTSCSVIGALYLGQTVTINETLNGWYKITTAGGVVGYVASQYITVGSSTGSGSTGNNSGSSDVTPASGEGVCNTDALNVRSGASTSSAILGFIANGTKVTITGTSGDWYKVNTTIGGTAVTGFVHKTYITMGSGSGGNSDNSGNSETQTPASGEGVCNTSALNVRKEASTSAQTYGLISQGAKVTILAKNGAWYQVKTKVNGTEVTGYVHSDYITVSSSGNGGNSGNGAVVPEDPSEITPMSGEGVCNTTALNVRKEASTSSTVLGLIYKDAKVTLLGQSGDFYQVKAAVNGTEVTGFVHKSYINVTQTPQEPEAPETPETPDESEKPEESGDDQITEVDEKVWATATVNVRKEASTKAAIIATLRKDGSVIRTGVLGNGWSRVSYDGQTAYIHSDYLTTTNPNPDSGSDENTGDSGITNVTGEDIVNFAKKWVGYPYVWGGNDLNTGVDCSGFTSQVYLHFGIQLNRVADAQKKNGIRIGSVEEAKAGDLFFYGTSSYADHVAIYMGDGNVVHASSPRVGIIISPVSYRQPVAIVRVIY